MIVIIINIIIDKICLNLFSGVLCGYENKIYVGRNKMENLMFY